MTFKKGDIIWPRKRTQDSEKLRHPAIVWDDEISGEADFTGIMLTSSGPSTYSDNISMNKGHFESGFYNNTHFVNHKFIKFAAWGPFEKVGALSKEGIEFIEENLSGTDPLPFDDYINRFKK